MFHVEQLEWIPQALMGENIPVHSDLLNQFKVYYQLLLEWNKRIPLISRTDESRIVTRHFLESIGLLTVVHFPLHARVLDIGSGGGFPGLPLKIVRPDLEMILIESKAKKARFLEKVVEELGLSGIQIIPARVECLQNRINGFEIAVSRAVGDVFTLIQWLIPFVSSSELRCVMIKGKKLEQELRLLETRTLPISYSYQIVQYNPFPKYMTLLSTFVIELNLWNKD